VKVLLDGTDTAADDVDTVDDSVDAVLVVELVELVELESVVADTTDEYAPRAVPSDLRARTCA
jgi:hypothetical protein